MDIHDECGVLTKLIVPGIKQEWNFAERKLAVLNLWKQFARGYGLGNALVQNK